MNSEGRFWVWFWSVVFFGTASIIAAIAWGSSIQPLQTPEQICAEKPFRTDFCDAVSSKMGVKP